MKPSSKLAIIICMAGITGAPGYAANPADASDPRNCPARGEPGRAECLRNMVQRGEAENARNNAYYQSLNRSMEKACTAADTADAAARVAGRSPPGPIRAAGRVWGSARALADFALGQRRECEKLRRELRGR
jgi:hypothetical protein